MDGKPEVYLSKSLYTRGVQCLKMLWMNRHMKETFDASVMNQAVLDTGNEVGDLAMGYYGPFMEVPFNEHKHLMLEETARLMAADTPIICEASFSFDGNFCSVDILRVEPDGVRITEVKSSTHLAEIYLHDMAYQTWVLSHCGLNVKSVELMHVDNTYVRHGSLDLRGLFCTEDCTETVMAMQPEVEETIAKLRQVAACPDEPGTPIGLQCGSPYECGYKGWCWRYVPHPGVFDLNRMSETRAFDLMGQGIRTFADVAAAGLDELRLSRRQKAQVVCELEGLERLVDRDDLQRFLDGLTYPLYFLDFETWQPAIPPFDGTKPYQQIPTQYSLHILREPGGTLEHREFLAPSEGDPRRAVAEHLVADIPAGVCTLAYNMAFEKSRIAELAACFPDLAEGLLAIKAGMQDLIVPFSTGACYVAAMGKSNSIKQVLPALFPDDPELDYHKLEGVHNGAEAMDAFPRLAAMSPEDEARSREQLLRYCELDTYAMVKILRRLEEFAGE